MPVLKTPRNNRVRTESRRRYALVAETVWVATGQSGNAWVVMRSDNLDTLHAKRAKMTPYWGSLSERVEMTIIEIATNRVI
jgi:hypothetical protein